MAADMMPHMIQLTSMIEEAGELITSLEPYDVALIDSWIHRASDALTTLNKTLSVVSVSEMEDYMMLLRRMNRVIAKMESTRIIRAETASDESRQDQQERERVQWVDVIQSFRGRSRSCSIINMCHISVDNFLNDACRLFVDKMPQLLESMKIVKVNAVFRAKFKKVADYQDNYHDNMIPTLTQPMYTSTDIPSWFQQHVTDYVLSQLEEFHLQGSGWSLDGIIDLEVNIHQYNPMRPGSHIPLPAFIANKKACVNVKNKDEKCFMWAILSAIHPVPIEAKTANRISSYAKWTGSLSFGDIQFPVSLDDVAKFERLNNQISVNVFGYNAERKQVFGLYVTAAVKEKHVNLLLIQSEDRTKSHYVWIKSLSKLCKSQSNPTDHRRRHFCDGCLHTFGSQEILDRHSSSCGQLTIAPVPSLKFPAPGRRQVRFRNHKNQNRVPFTVYADLECILKPTESAKRSQLPGESVSSSSVLHEHEVFAIGYQLIAAPNDHQQSFYADYQAETGATRWFASQLLQLAKKLDPLFDTFVSIQELTPEQSVDFLALTNCYICDEPFDESNQDRRKVKDHCHFTGEYRGPAHSGCNLKYQPTRTVPVVFHNLSGYDSHFILRDICNAYPGKVDLLPINKERYTSFTKHVEGTGISFRFIDSYRFMSSSLAQLASNLSHYPITEACLRQECAGENSTEQQRKFNLVTEKGLLPYEYLDSYRRMAETQLPAKEAFYSRLYDCDISDEEYRRAQDVWTTFGVKNLGEYVSLYMKVDVLLLADVFENFRERCLESYNLDPAHYYSAPGLAWDAMLKYTGIELQLLSDPDMITFLESGIRGGISQASNRHAVAQNKYTGATTENSTFIAYWDANNLYGWAMSQHLPTGSFEWISPESAEVKAFASSQGDILPEDGAYGYILQVDLEYPETLHDAHSDLPFCPENAKPPSCQQEKKLQSKLLTTLSDKTDYVIHYRNLKQALKHGLKLKAIRRVLKFRQSAWLKSYIDFNTAMRAAARNDFDKDFYKLMNNSVFGKTMENVRKHVDVRMITRWEGRYGLEDLISKPHFNSATSFAEELVAVQMNREQVLFNKPIYVGFAILDISKTLMYQFHYEHTKVQYPREKSKLLYTDTDSFVYEFITDDIYRDIRENADKFDTSNYPVDNPYGIKRLNNRVPGKFKDEAAGKIVTGYVGLRSKMYALTIQGGETIKKAKGVKTHVVKRNVTYADYLECLHNFVTTSREQCLIRSRRHVVQTIRQNKLALSPYDDKRYLIPGSTDTLAWGHYAIPQNQQDQHMFASEDDAMNTQEPSSLSLTHSVDQKMSIDDSQTNRDTFADSQADPDIIPCSQAIILID